MLQLVQRQPVLHGPLGGAEQLIVARRLLPIEAMSRLWAALQQPLRTSVVLTVRAVQIEAEEPAVADLAGAPLENA